MLLLFSSLSLSPVIHFIISGERMLGVCLSLRRDFFSLSAFEVIVALCCLSKYDIACVYLSQMLLLLSFSSCFV